VTASATCTCATPSPGDINRSIGRGEVNFPAAIDALASAGYRGHYSLELETHDIEDADRPAEAGRAGRYISGLLRGGPVPAAPAL
jgi:sugar phosphate isomerase/epimerase